MAQAENLEKCAPNIELHIEENVSSVSEADNSLRTKYELKEDMKQKLADLPEVLEFIEMLQKYIEKQRKKLKKWKSKIKKYKQGKDVSVQVDIKDTDISNGDGVVLNEKPKTLAEDIKEAAEMATQNSGFVYEETSGMYYDYSTGYYYNAEYGLYYDGNTGIYYKYNQDSQSYEFHSQVAAQKDDTSVNQDYFVNHTHKKKSKRKNEIGQKSKDAKRTRSNSRKAIEVEEGECSQSSDSSVSENDGDVSDGSDVSKQWPPCMRIITESTEVSKLKVGSLHIITFEGGTIGREGRHSITIPDINISKHHLKIHFNKETGQYLVTDLGSRNGTLLNGKRMSSSKQESDAMEISHGSKLQIGGTVFLCHIHEGSQTCGHCEPGLLQQPEEIPQRIYKLNKKTDMQNELRNLRKKFGVGNVTDDTKLADGYTDRAQKRRDEIGSQNPHEKTQVASVDESISSENKGFKLLSKMGWKEGQSLGKDNEGIKEPVKVVANQGTAGIGSNDPINSVKVPENKKMIWRKTQERFQKLPSKNDAFEEEDSD